MLNGVMKKSWVLGAVVLFLGFLIIIGSFVVIPAGSEGIVIQFGAVTGTTMQQGLHFKMPFVQSIVKMDIRTQKYTADGLTAASKDLQNVTTNIAINFKLDTTQASTVYRNIGPDYMEVIAHPAIQETVKEITAKYNAEECITNRAEVKDAINNALVARLSVRGIITESVNITDFQFSPEFTAAIEAKVVAQQQIETAQNTLERMRVEAEQAVVVATGQANAAIAAAQGQAQSNQIVAQSLSPDILAAMLYGKIGPNDKIIIVPNTGFSGGIVVNP
jgi:regulator of protease activity HflC (stomatin/prohibitin superfamily)